MKKIVIVNAHGGRLPDPLLCTDPQWPVPGITSFMSRRQNTSLKRKPRFRRSGRPLSSPATRASGKPVPSWQSAQTWLRAGGHANQWGGLPLWASAHLRGILNIDMGVWWYADHPELLPAMGSRQPRKREMPGWMRAAVGWHDPSALSRMIRKPEGCRPSFLGRSMDTN